MRKYKDDKMHKTGSTVKQKTTIQKKPHTNAQRNWQMAEKETDFPQSLFYA